MSQFKQTVKKKKKQLFNKWCWDSRLSTWKIKAIQNKFQNNQRDNYRDRE